MHRTAAKLALALLVVSAIAVPASAGSRSDRSGAPGVQRVTESVRIVDFGFRPRRIEVDRGTRVRWANQGQAPHTATGGAWDSGTMSSGETFSRVFKRAGTFRYSCTIHPDMTGRVVVT